MKNVVRIVAVTQVILLLLVSFAFVRTTSSLPLTWNIEIADPKGAWDPSIAVDGNNNPHIAYTEVEISGDQDLKYAVKSGMGWSLEIVESEGMFYLHPSIAVDSNENPHISYSKGVTLKYATKIGATWLNETISTSARVSSITTDAINVPHVSYFWHNGSSKMEELKYAVKSGIGWIIETVDPYIVSGSIGERGTSIKLDSNGEPHISYLANFTIKYAAKSGGSWSIETLDSGASIMHTSIALDASANPHIAYWNESNWELRYVEKVGVFWNIETVESLGGDWGGDISLAIDSSGNPCIGYTDYLNRHVKYAVRNGSNWVIDIVDNGSASSMALDANDNPHFSYWFPWPVYGLKYATWVPDLEVTIGDMVFNPPSPVSNGTSVLINATIHNIGNALANNVIVRFYDGDPGDPLGTGPGVPINGDQIITLIAAGNYSYAEVRWNATPIGTHTIYVVVDPSDSILEYNESNNIANKTISVVKLPEPIAPELFIEVVDDSGDPDGKGSNILLSWIPPPSSMIAYYLIYRATSPIGFNFSAPWVDTNNTLANGLDPVDKLVNPTRLSWNHTGAADPNDGVNYSQQRYYCIRAVNTLGEASYTSRTVGKWTKEFTLGGVSTFSLPLEPFIKRETEFYCQEMNATYIKWMNQTTHTWMRHDKGDTGNNTIIEIGEGYEIGFLGKSTQTKYTFCGMPGAMIIFKDDKMFLGFDPMFEAKSLEVWVEPNGDVNLTWWEPPTMGPGDYYEIYYSSTRDGFFGAFNFDYFQAFLVDFGINTAIHVGAGANDPGARLYYMVVPFNDIGVMGASTYSIGIWTEEYLSGYDTFGIPLKMNVNHAADWYCDNIPDAVGINYFIFSLQEWGWHATRMPEGAYDPLLEITEGYQISSSSPTKFTFIGV